MTPLDSIQSRPRASLAAGPLAERRGQGVGRGKRQAEDLEAVVGTEFQHDVPKFRCTEPGSGDERTGQRYVHPDDFM